MDLAHRPGFHKGLPSGKSGGRVDHSTVDEHEVQILESERLPLPALALLAPVWFCSRSRFRF